MLAEPAARVDIAAILLQFDMFANKQNNDDDDDGDGDDDGLMTLMGCGT